MKIAAITIFLAVLVIPYFMRTALALRRGMKGEDIIDHDGQKQTLPQRNRSVMYSTGYLVTFFAVIGGLVCVFTENLSIALVLAGVPLLMMLGLIMVGIARRPPATCAHKPIEEKSDLESLNRFADAGIETAMKQLSNWRYWVAAVIIFWMIIMTVLAILVECVWS